MGSSKMCIDLGDIDSGLTFLKYLAEHAIPKDSLPPMGEPAPLNLSQRESLQLIGEEISSACLLYRWQDCYLYLVEVTGSLTSALVNTLAQRVYSTGALSVVLCFTGPDYKNIAWVCRDHAGGIEKACLD